MKLSDMNNIEIDLIAYGIAKDILGERSTKMTIKADIDLSELKSQLKIKYPKLEDLMSIRFAVNESYQDEDFIISAGDEVVIVPPVSGG